TQVVPLSRTTATMSATLVNPVHPSPRPGAAYGPGAFLETHARTAISLYTDRDVGPSRDEHGHSTGGPPMTRQFDPDQINALAGKVGELRDRYSTVGTDMGDGDPGDAYGALPNAGKASSTMK